VERERAIVSQPAALAVDHARVEQLLRQRAADARALLLRRLPQGRDVLRSLLVDRLTFTPFAAQGTHGYRFAGRASYGSLLAGAAWPTTDSGPNGTRSNLQNSSARFHCALMT